MIVRSQCGVRLAVILRWIFHELSFLFGKYLQLKMCKKPLQSNGKMMLTTQQNVCKNISNLKKLNKYILAYRLIQFFLFFIPKYKTC